jgi:hypothetical protein
VPHHRADAKRRDRRQLDRLERLRSREQTAIDIDERALIDHRRLHEPIPIPLRRDVGWLARSRARLGDIQEQRPEPRWRQPGRQRVIRAIG